MAHLCTLDFLNLLLVPRGGCLGHHLVLFINHIIGQGITKVDLTSLCPGLINLEYSRYWETQRRIQGLINQLPGFSIMGNPTEEDAASTGGADNEEYIVRTNPTCKSLQKDLERIHTLLNTVRSQVVEGLDNVNMILTNDVDGIVPRLSSVECATKTHDKRLQDLEDKLALVVASDKVTIQASPKLEAQQNLMQSRLESAAVIISSLEKQIKSTNSRVLYNSQLHNVNKYRISGIPYVEGEDPFVEMTTFLQDIMKVTVNTGDIITASQMPGTITVRIKGTPVQLPPQMFVQVTCHLQKCIAANMSELDDKTDSTDGHFYKVKQQVPDAVQGVRQHFNPIVVDVHIKNQGKSRKDRMPFYFQGTDLFVDGKKVKEPVKPPSRAEILSISPQEQKLLNDINPQVLSQDSKDGSKFFGYAVHAYDLKFIKRMYLRLRQLHLMANHIIMAFRIEDTDNPAKVIEGSCHDEETHGDVTLARILENTHMKNVVVFVVRYYGGTPLRALRLKMIADAAHTVLHSLQSPAGEDPIEGEDDWSEQNLSDPSQVPSATTSPTHPLRLPHFENSSGRPNSQVHHGRGAAFNFGSCGFKPYQQSKKQKLDFESTMAYSLNY